VSNAFSFPGIITSEVRIAIRVSSFVGLPVYCRWFEKRLKINRSYRFSSFFVVASGSVPDLTPSGLAITRVTNHA
jgi:hypothetical protein